MSLVRNLFVISIIAVFASLIVFTVAAGAVPGLPTTDPGEKSFDMKAKIVVKADETGAPVLNRESFRSCIEKSGLLNFNFVAGTDQLSVLEAEDVEVQWTLQGPIDLAVSEKDRLGNIGKLGGSKTADFKASNLPTGTYVLHMNAFSSGGSDYTRETIQVTDQNSVSSCGGFLK